MLILLGVAALVFIVSIVWTKWGLRNESWRFRLVVSLIIAVAFGSMGGSMVLAGARAYFEEEVEVKYPIYEGPSGRYADNGTSGEYNDQITIWYWKDGSSMRKAWKSANSVGINSLPEGRSAYAYMTCPSGETLPEWLKMPWEKGDHEWDAECGYEFVNLYIPEGEM